MPAGTLLLFDIDGTLVGRAATEHAAALREALLAVHGSGLDLSAAKGRLSQSITR